MPSSITFRDHEKPLACDNVQSARKHYKWLLAVTVVTIAGSLDTPAPQQPDLGGPDGEEAAEGAVVPRGRPRLGGRGGRGTAGGWRSPGHQPGRGLMRTAVSYLLHAPSCSNN